MAAQYRENFEQPMSLLRIGGIRHTDGKTPPTKLDETDLLTIRILESSERKMRLIKELLSPEEYDSLSSDLFTSIMPLDRNQIRTRTRSIEQPEQARLYEVSEPKSGPPFLAGSPRHGNYIETQFKQIKRLSRSETNLDVRSASLAMRMARVSHQSVQENLNTRRRAMEFFFGNHMVEAGGSSPATNLTIELRFGYYIRPDMTAENKLIDQSGDAVSGLGYLLSLALGLYLSLIQFLGRCYNSSSPTTDELDAPRVEAAQSTANNKEQELERAFQRRHKNVSASPYCVKRNIAVFIRRLRRDQHFHRLLDHSSSPSISERSKLELNPTKSQNLYDQLVLIKTHSDLSLRLMSDLNQRVISLRTSHQMPSDTAVDFNLLILPPLVAKLTRRWSKQSLDAGAPSASTYGSAAQIRCHPNLATVSLKLESLKLVKHKLFSNEEKLALRLYDVFQRYQENLVKPLNKIVSRLNEMVTKFSHENLKDPLECSLDDAIRLMDQIFRLIEARAKLLSKISIEQRKLSMIWSELKAIIDEQNFNTTFILNLSYDSCAADSTSQHGATICSLDTAALARLREFLREMSFDSQSVTTQGATSERQKSFLKKLERFNKFFSSETSNLNVKYQVLPAVQLITNGAYRTQDEACPSGELKRRDALKRWLSSLHVRLILNENFDYEAPIRSDNISADNEDHLLRVDFPMPNELKINQSDPSRALKLTIELYRRGPISYMPSLLAGLATRRLLSSSTFRLDTQPEDMEHKYELQIEAPTERHGGDESEDEEPTRLALKLSVKSARQSSALVALNARLVDQLYSVLFDRAERSGFENAQTKASALINRINPRVVLALIGKIQSKEEVAHSQSIRGCLLEPYLPFFEHQLEQRFERFDLSSAQSSSTAALPNVRPVSLRCALLVWRWVTSTSTAVYMNERENNQALAGIALGSETSQALDELKARLKSRSSALEQAEVAGYKSIERQRSLALDYVRQCELLIEQIIGLNKSAAIDASGNGKGEAATGAQQTRRPARARDVVLEPHLKLTRPNLPNVALLVRALVPRATARRPLMPNRRRDQAAPPSGSSKLSQLVAMSHLKSSRGDTRDLESASLAQWQRFTGKRTSAGAVRSGSTPRLVVTIQKATNVPFRLVHAHTLRPQMQAGFSGPVPSWMTRSASPSFLAPFATGSSGGRSGAATPIQLQQSFLALSTTYVEVTFQRQQLASSLAQGKDPAWNETLFFGVDLGDSTALDGQQQQQELVDEFLHLNLYDCRCYTQDPMQDSLQLMRDDSQSQLLNARSLLPGSASRQQLLLPAQHQRIERHLIGSLQVPLSVLLTTNGRIEGSFALNQPLLLEHNYQFDQSSDIMTLTPGPRKAAASPAEQRTSLSVFITLDPPVTMPQNFYLPTDSHERADLFEYAQLWERVLQQAPARIEIKRRQAATSGTRSRAALNSGRLANGTTGCAPYIRALVLRDDARYCLASRFLVAMEPPSCLLRAAPGESQDDSGQIERDGEPASLVDEQQKMRRLARFVSLLSPLKHGLFSMRPLASCLWFDSHQLLNESLGGPEEKAILLCNYFLHLGKCAALLLGDCIPDGRCVYVLVWSSDRARTTTSQLELQVSELMETLGAGAAAGRPARTSQQEPPVEPFDFIARLPIVINARTCQLWDPKSGTRHRLSGSTAAGQVKSPLVMSIGSIVTMENIYANLQSVAPTHPSEINFDIRLKQLWCPLFSAQALPGGQLAAESVERLLDSVRRDGRKIMAQPNWRKQLAHLDQLSKLIGRAARPTSFISELAPGRQDSINYSLFSRAKCQELREALERSIKSQLLIWRPTRPTYFNRTLSRMIADKLASFERVIFSDRRGGHGREDDVSQEQVDDAVDLAVLDEGPNWWRAQLAELIRAEILDVPTLSASNETRQVISWPINLAYTSTRVILDGLYASGVHNADLVMSEQQQQLPQVSINQEIGPVCDLSSQFLVACHVEPYPARVMSVWLYVGAIVSTKNVRQAN